jgi:hypothetical protein
MRCGRGSGCQGDNQQGAERFHPQKLHDLIPAVYPVRLARRCLPIPARRSRECQALRLS